MPFQRRKQREFSSVICYAGGKVLCVANIIKHGYRSVIDADVRLVRKSRGRFMNIRRGKFSLPRKRTGRRFMFAAAVKSNGWRPSGPVRLRILACGGADWWLKTFQKLPDYYITEAEAATIGWKKHLGNLGKVAPGKMLQKGVYQNRNHHLPEAPGRIWYEADINYTGGFRGVDRILYSNDGLIFVTYDHYKTFVEII